MGYVLFDCSHNAGRWPMAQAFFRRHASKGLRECLRDDICDALAGV
jgi:protein-tyrosine-phosphatase